MAQLDLDTTGNESNDISWWKTETMFTELYGLITGAAASVVGSLQIGSGTRTASATAGAATLNTASGIVTSESITTAAGANYTLTITNSKIVATDIVMASVQFGTNTQGTPEVSTITPAAGSVVIVIKNTHATLAFNGTIKVAFVQFK